MNRHYRLIWNERLQSWVPVAEIVRGRSKRSHRDTSGAGADKSIQSGAAGNGLFSRLTLAMALCLCGSQAFANPTGGQVAAGSASIQTSASQVTVNQQSNKAIINWQGFSVNQGESTRFNQPSANSITLNRVTGQDPSKILGNLSANGQVWLVNPNGVYFGANATVDVSGLLATTHDIGNDNFMAGNYQFNTPGRADASIVNAGSITINNAGLAAFVAPAVRNDGVILARLGQVEMASGTGFSLDLYGDRLIELAVDPQAIQAYTTDGEALSSFVENNGSIEAQTVVMSANAVRDVVDDVINMSGHITATTASQSGGKIILGGDVSQGDINVSGTLDASATNQSAPADGGEIIVYGDNTTIESTAVLKAEGGTAGGDGGFIETSGTQVIFDKDMQISTYAENGDNGTWLVDPGDFVIVPDDSAQTANAIGAITLMELLAVNNVTLQATATLVGGNSLDGGNIIVDGSFSYGGTSTLTLWADQSIHINAEVSLFDNAQIVIDALRYFDNNIVNFAAPEPMVFHFRENGGEFAGSLDLFDSSNITIDGAAYNVIRNYNQLSSITDMNGLYVLGNDITVSNTDPAFVPIGYVDQVNGADPFNGIFNGLGHVVSDITISDPGLIFTGFIADLGSGQLTATGLENASISAFEVVGGLAGRANTNALIYNSYFKGNVTSSIGGEVSQAGGLVGSNLGQLAYSHFEGSVSAADYAGGLVASNNGTIYQGYVSDQSTVSSTAALSAGYAAGGLIGSNSGDLHLSVSLANVTGDYFAGGLIGIMSSGNLSESLATGLVTVTDILYGSPKGLVGSNLCSANCNFSGLVWDMDSTGTSDPGVFNGATSITATDRYLQSSYTAAGWDFNTDWRIDAGNDYPIFRQVLGPTPVSNSVYWDGGAGSLNWNDARNWSGNAIPGTGDTVSLNNTVGTLTVSGDIGSAANPLDTLFDAFTFNSTGGVYINNTAASLSLSGTATSDINITNSGALNLVGNLTSSGNVSLTSSGGTITTGSANYIQANALQLITGGSVGSSALPVNTDANSLDFGSGGSVFVINNSSALGFAPGVFSVFGSASADVDIVNYGETIVPSGNTFAAGGYVVLTAKSPLTINGTLTGGGSINLTASNPGNLSITGSVSSSGGGAINLNAPGGVISGNIPAGAVLSQATVPATIVPVENIVTTNTTLLQTEEAATEAQLVENNTQSTGQNDELPEILQLAPELAEIIYLDYLKDSLPPAGPTSGIPLPDLNKVALVEALLELYQKDYTPEDRRNFYDVLTIEQVVDSLRLSNEIELADFFLELAEEGLFKESDLMEILNKKDVSKEQKVAYLGVYVRMRQVAIHKLLEPAIKMLRENPGLADVISEGVNGGDINFKSGNALTYMRDEQIDRFASSTGTENTPDSQSLSADSREILRNLLETENGLIQLNGQAQSRSKLLNLRVNNQWAFIDEDGNYRITLPVNKGQSEITLLVNDPSGVAEKTSYTVRSQQDGELKVPAGRRFALMIGVEEYDYAIPELETPVKDVQDVSVRLEQTQFFETRRMENPTKQELLDEMISVSRAMQENDTLMIYYAGHGYLMKETGRGYWLPRDASPDNPANWLSNRDVSRIFHKTRAKQILLVSDSCYSGAFIGAAGREIIDDSQFVGRPRAVMGLSSGGETPVWDGGGSGNSIFAAKLLETLGLGEVQGQALYKQVKNRVVAASPQVPGYGAMLMPGYDDGGDFKLRH